MFKNYYTLISSRSFLLILFFFLFSSNIVTSSNTNFHPQVGFWLEYSVLDSSETINAFYGAWPPGDFFGNWSVANGDLISFEVKSLSQGEISGVISLGSVIFSHVRNIDAASALLLSIYPWSGGFFANASNWEEIFLLLDGTNTTIHEVENYEQTINETAKFFTVELFETINYYGQNSTLKYDRDTGVLLYACSSFGNYLLEISLSASNFLLGTSSQTKTTQSPTLLFSILILLLFSVYRRFKRIFFKIFSI